MRKFVQLLAALTVIGLVVILLNSLAMWQFSLLIDPDKTSFLEGPAQKLTGYIAIAVAAVGVIGFIGRSAGRALQHRDSEAPAPVIETLKVWLKGLVVAGVGIGVCVLGYESFTGFQMVLRSADSAEEVSGLSALALGFGAITGFTAAFMVAMPLFGREENSDGS